jgi:glycosyltransferase involved in cell wall biosynthesis
MAHKIRVPLYRRLRDLLDATGKSYSVFVSTALHENTSFDGSFVVRFEELQALFNGQVYFMGYLSDTAVFNHLMDCTFLAAFFEKGLRANNTTVNAAMECGCAVITNLDEYSPKGLVHGRNVIDINKCDRLPDFEQAAQLGRAAREIAHADYGWEQLVAQLRPVVIS